MSYPLKVITLKSVDLFTEKLSPQDEAKFDASIKAIRLGKYEVVYTKPLKRVLRELIIKRFRFIFFINKDTVYFISAFVKKTSKTPKIEIKNAEKIYKIITKI